MHSSRRRQQETKAPRLHRQAKRSCHVRNLANLVSIRREKNKEVEIAVGTNNQVMTTCSFSLLQKLPGKTGTYGGNHGSRRTLNTC